MRSEMQALFGGGDRTAIQEKMSKLREEMEQEVLAVLTSDQQKKFEEMKGEPFEMVLTNPGSKGDNGSRNPAFLAKNPAGTIPTKL